MTRSWSTYGARGLVAQTHAPMTGIQPLASDVLHGELVLNDHLGSLRLRLSSQHQDVLDGVDRDYALLDVVVSGWTPQNPMDYTPFGRELAQDNSAKTTPEGYTGKPLDTTFGLQAMNYGARFYDPRLGRWWQRDPLAEKRSDNSPYQYCVNNPIINVDLFGLIDVDITNDALNSHELGQVVQGISAVMNNENMKNVEVGEEGVFGIFKVFKDPVEVVIKKGIKTDEEGKMYPEVLGESVPGSRKVVVYAGAIDDDKKGTKENEHIIGIINTINHEIMHSTIGKGNNDHIPGTLMAEDVSTLPQYYNRVLAYPRNVGKALNSAEGEK